MLREGSHTPRESQSNLQTSVPSCFLCRREQVSLGLSGTFLDPAGENILGISISKKTSVVSIVLFVKSWCNWICLGRFGRMVRSLVCLSIAALQIIPHGGQKQQHSFNPKSGGCTSLGSSCLRSCMWFHAQGTETGGAVWASPSLYGLPLCGLNSQTSF